MKYNLFESYVWKSKIKYDNKNKLIKKLLEDFSENKNKFTRKWNCFVYSSFDEDIQKNIPDDLIDSIEEKILEYLKECPEHLQINGKYIIHQIWYNIYENNYFQETHNHEGALFSGCYYLKFNKEKHHQTTFYNPNYTLDHSKIKNNRYFCFDFDCDEDDIIIFPSNLKHGTQGLKEKNCEETRITISFNVMNPDVCLEITLKDEGFSYS